MALWNPKQEPVTGAEPSSPPGRFPDAPPARREEPLPRREEAPSPTGDLLLGPGAEFDGKLTFRGTVRIDAKFTGSITTSDVLVVGEHGHIDAEITCGTVIVHGEVNGNVRASNAVEIRHTGRIHGDITAPSLMVEKGALLQGAVRHGERVGQGSW
ncbi:MAG TPA: polymer-forming cytoskeletal protein [Anaeromyxobacter sp.]|nr:polymer-forming cytoskeletal protein [Anaeromyxobacter sp.]